MASDDSLKKPDEIEELEKETSEVSDTDETSDASEISDTNEILDSAQISESSEKSDSDEISESAEVSEKLTPESVAEKKDTSEKALKGNKKSGNSTKDQDFWKKLCMVLMAVILVGIVAGVAGYYAGKKGSSGNSSKTDTSDDQSSEPRANYISKSAEKISKSAKRRQHKDIIFTVDEIKEFCKENGLQIQNGQTSTGFLAINETMGMIVTVEELQGKTFDELVNDLVVSSAPLNSKAFEMSDNMLLYEGYLDKDQPSYGYCYLELLCGDKYYIFLQGLGDTPSSADIAQMRILAFRMEKLLKLR